MPATQGGFVEYLQVAVNLIEAIAWPLLIFVFLKLFHIRITNILKVIKERISLGAEFSAGPEGIKLGKLESIVKEQSRRIDQITVSTENTLQSLASLVIADPTKIPAYMQDLEKRVEQDKILIVGCQQYTEQRILCAIIAKLLEREATRNSDSGFKKVIPKYDFGGAGLNFIALIRSDIDIYPAYTWQGFEMAYATSLPESASLLMKLAPDKAIRELNSIFESLSNPLSWLCHTGFHDDWELVMREDDAKNANIRSISDLRKLDCTLTLGLEHDFFARPNGYSLLKNSVPDGYGLAFKELKLFYHRDAYDALDNNEVDIIVGFTTDPQRQRKYRYAYLKDDEKRFGHYYSSIVARSRLLHRHKSVRKALLSLEGQIGPSEMTHMIQYADTVSSVYQREAHITIVEDLAIEFLDKKNL